jgi:hypothetical protein
MTTAPRNAARGALLCLLAALLAACTPSDGYVAELWHLGRAHEYLETITPELRPGSVINVLAFLERDTRWNDLSLPPDFVPEDAFDATFDKLWRLQDTSDFNVVMLLNLLYAHRGHPALPEALWEKTEQAVLDFKYWYVDPTPERVVDGQPVVDAMWYWSENHILIFRTCEYLAGQLYPDRVFSVTGWTGALHRERARAAILAWLEERARWGFTEWHSNVYYQWDIIPLITLVEWAEDEEIARRASMVLDLLLFDIAMHLHRGTFGATHGRSYPKDFPAAILEDTFALSKFLFDDTELPWVYPGRSSGESNSTMLFARSRNYRLPEVIRRIARSDAPLVDRERMSLPVTEKPPKNWYDPVPPAPYGLGYEEEHLEVWWGMASHTAYPVVPMTLRVANQYDLFKSQFADFATFNQLVWVEGNEGQTLLNIHTVAKRYWQAINQSLLTEVNTYTHRTRDYMLSTAQDWRKGLRGSQTHTWQATLDEKAMVFTRHPASVPIGSGQPVPELYDWNREEPGPGYWTGEASQPRAAQHENVTIAIYAPQYADNVLAGLFRYRNETHAYFPTAHFDEWLQEGHWTFGRKGDAYVALFSHLPTAWRSTQPQLFENAGQPFDLVAAGSAQNVWIVELGSRSTWGSFANFVAVVSDSAVVVTPLGDAAGDGFTDGFDVAYGSPSLGTISFGWHAPLVVEGVEQPLSGYPRYDNPYARTEFDDTRYEISDGAFSLLLDFASAERVAAAPPE